MANKRFYLTTWKTAGHKFSDKFGDPGIIIDLLGHLFLVKLWKTCSDIGPISETAIKGLEGGR